MVTMRKVERYTVLRETEHIMLDPERFRGISNPYEGSTDKEFIEYIEEKLGEFYEDDDLWNELDEDTQYQLGKFFEPEYSEFYNSAWDGEDSFIQTGKDEDGHFIVEESTERF